MVPSSTFLLPESPIILVGTNKELREDTETLKKLRENELDPITYSQGLKMQKEIGIYKYVECSSVTLQNVQLVFEEAIRSAPMKNKK